MADTLKNVLMERDGLTEQEAREEVNAARDELMDRLGNGDMPFHFCEEIFGLEPDYLEELLF